MPLKQKIEELTQSYIGMTPKDKGVVTWLDMQRKFTSEILKLIEDNYVPKEKLTDEQIENWLFHKIGKRETMTEKEYLTGMIMAKYVRDNFLKVE